MRNFILCGQTNTETMNKTMDSFHGAQCCSSAYIIICTPRHYIRCNKKSLNLIRMHLNHTYSIEVLNGIFPLFSLTGRLPGRRRCCFLFVFARNGHFNTTKPFSLIFSFVQLMKHYALLNWRDYGYGMSFGWICIWVCVGFNGVWAVLCVTIYVFQKKVR